MSDRNLLMLFTRMEGKDEWDTVWNLPKDHLIAFIRPSEVKTLGVSDLGMFELANELDADVWVIHGNGYQGEESEVLDAALNKIDWKEQAVTVRIHRGGAASVESEDFQDEIAAIQHENTRELLKRAENYSIGDTDPPDHPVVRFARAVREPSQETEYKECLEALTARTPLYMRIADTMHHLSYVLHPLDIDFQGLQDTDFQLDYWKEVVEDYKGGKAVAKLVQTKDLIYGKAGSADDNAQSVMVEAERRFGTGTWYSSWEELQKHHLPKTDGPANIETILPLMQDDSQANLEKVKTHFTGGKNPIHEWVTNINRTLGEIRDALSARERGLKTE